MQQNHSETEDKNIIAIYSEGVNYGIARFDPVTTEIIISNTVEIGDQDYSNSLISLLIIPFSKIILHPNADKDFLSAVKSIRNCCWFDQQKQRNNESTNNHTEDIILFNYLDTTKSNFQEFLFKFNFSGISSTQQNLDNLQKLHYIHQLLDLDNLSAIKALAQVLTYLLSSQTINYSFQVQNIKMEIPAQIMYLSLKTYSQLSIFKEEIHPSQIKGKGRSKEGFSLFNLYDSMIASSQGRRRLRRWFLTPTYDQIILEGRLKTIQFLTEKLSLFEFEKLQNGLSKFYDLQLLINKFGRGSAKKEDWNKLSLTLKNFTSIQVEISLLVDKAKQSHLEIPQILHEFKILNCSCITAIVQLLEKCIRCNEYSRIGINTGVSKELDRLRNLAENLDEMLSFYARQEIAKLQEDQNNSLVITFMPYFGYLIGLYNKPNISKISIENTVLNEVKQIQRFLVNLKANLIKKSQNKGDLDLEPIQIPEDWKLEFRTNDFIYYRSNITSHLDRLYGDIAGRITDLEHEILLEIEKEVKIISELLTHRSQMYLLTS